MNERNWSPGCMGKTGVVLLVLLAVCSGPVVAQQSLGDIVTEMGFGWMAGRWTATTNDGDQIELVYRWTAEKHAIVVDFKMGETSSHGMIYYSPLDEQVHQIGVDSEGNITKGTWNVVGERAIVKSERTDAYGEKRSMALGHSKAGADAMKIELFGIEYGQVAETPSFALEFKRQKKQAR